MKKTYLYVFILVLIFPIMIFITINKFNGIREQYKTIEPNLDNYSTAEITLLAFERMKVALLATDSKNEFLIKKKIFDSKIKILENKSNDIADFFYDKEFLSLLEKLKSQSDRLSTLYSANSNSEKQTLNILTFMNEMQPTLTDLQEVIYRIQISHFDATKEIIKDNSSYTKYYALLCIFLSFVLISLLWRHITKLKETLLNKNLFISAIYHELSNSIQKIQISSEMMDICNDVGSSTKYINNIKLHSKKIFHQTREILEYSKIEIGNIQLTQSTFYLKDLLSEASSSLNITNNNRIIIKKTSESKRITSDKQKLLSIIINLLDNANKNTKNGTIYLSLKLINSHLYLYVKDNGCGFDIKKIKTLYRPFNQGAEKETRQGLGLGLTIIKNYVKIFNGKIRAKSLQNRGSTFLVRVSVVAV